jgi:hypothetical protein
VAKDHVKMFVEEYSPIAAQVSKQTGIAPSVLMAQWGMETDYGRKVQGHFNFGNIKDLSGGGKEAKDNQTGSVDKYVNFESPEAFGDYYAHMMRRLYPKALNTGNDITKYAQGLKEGVQGSYAEAENYEEAIRGAHKTTSEFYSDEQPAAAAAPAAPASAAAPVDPFAGITSEAAKMKREEDERKKKEPAAAPVEDQAAKEAEQQIMGAVAGAAANAVLPALTNPEMPEKIDISKVQERANERADALELARRNFREQAGEFTSFEEIQNRNLANQQELERIKIEEREAQARLRGLPRTLDVVASEAAPSSLPSQVTREGRASGPKVEGDSGVRNWTIAEAGQKHQLPEAVLDLATDKTKESPTGGKALISKDLENIEKIKQLGMGDSRLVTLPSGAQLQLPENFASEIQTEAERQTQANQAEVEQRAEQARIQQQVQAQQLEQQRLAYEADLERLRQERAEAGRRLNESKAEVKNLTPLQRNLTATQTADELARQKLARARDQPNALSRALEVRGVQSGTGSPVARTVVGGLTGYYGVMSLQEAMARAKAGDTSEEVIAALKAGAAATSLVPPAGKGLTRLRGAGSFGVGAGLVHELYKALSKNPDQPIQ